MDGGAKTPPEASPKMTCGNRTRGGEFLDGDVSFKMRSQHLLSSKLLPWFQAASGWNCELWGAATRLQNVSAEHRGNLVERQPVKWLPVSDRGENIFCHLRHNHIFHKKFFPKLKQRCHSVVACDPL